METLKEFLSQHTVVDDLNIGMLKNRILFNSKLCAVAVFTNGIRVIPINKNDDIGNGTGEYVFKRVITD